ncbi:MAG: sigma-70 family RNA polymerase sigma factor [Gemmataceae bacterium]|nr:sigma-70 family RNA polymerase sigma factor [Gemmataceae bacterium]
MHDVSEGDQALHDSESRPTVEQVFRQYAPRIYHLARRILGNEADAQDVTQDVMLQVLRKLDTFRGDSSFPTWLHRVTVNAALAHRRRKAARHEQEAPETVEKSSDDGLLPRSLKPWTARPDEAMLNAEQQAVVEKAISELPEMYRDVFVLADVQQMSNAEIADLLNLSIPAVKSRLHRARMMMRNRLAPYFEEIGA